LSYVIPASEPESKFVVAVYASHKMQIIYDTITIDDIKKMLGNFFDDMVKAVVDVERRIVAVDAEMHADLEQYLLDDGSKQSDLWGVNIIPDAAEEKDFIVFDSIINLKPHQYNRKMYVEDANMRDKIIKVVKERIVK